MNSDRPDDWIEAERLKRKRLRTKYELLFSQVSTALFELDPIGLNFEENTDEYDAEAGTILPRLVSCRNVADVQAIVHEEFVRWFGADVAGEAGRYREVAERLFLIWESGGRPPLK